MKIEFEHVGKTYDGRRVLHDVNLVIEPGSRVGLVGPNGSGKSTLLRCLMGMIACDGTVRLDGFSPFADRMRIAQRLAYVPQSPPQLGATVREVTRAVCALHEMHPDAISERCNKLGLDLRGCEETPFRALSGGMKQKLLIALAFSAKSDVMILDEPTASLDARARGAFVEMVEEACGRGATVLLCSHRFEEVSRLVQRVVELDEGRLVRDLRMIHGSPEKAEPGGELQWPRP